MAMIKTICMWMIVLLLVSCGPRYVDYFPFYDDGTPKPKVALLPVIDSTRGSVPWDISQEINDGVRYLAMCHGRLFLLSGHEVAARHQGKGQPDYFGTDITYATKFEGNDYVVALELIEHRVVPYSEESCCREVSMQKYRWDALLQMKLRLRVLDMRCCQPKILLQEIFASNYAIPTGQEHLDYSRCGLGSADFDETPYGKAHARLIADLVSRIEAIICGI
jgi:hypothetical protein